MEESIIRGRKKYTSKESHNGGIERGRDNCNPPIHPREVPLAVCQEARDRLSDALNGHQTLSFHHAD
jgi:hypothetical protein